MISLIFSVDNKITDILVDKFDLIKVSDTSESGDFKIFKKWGIVLLECQKNEKLFRQAFLYWYSEFLPDLIFFVWTATKVSTEVQLWDVILPNVFFEYNTKLQEVEFDIANRDDFLKNPIFLEQYSLQNDYNFENFGLRIWWIGVTSLDTIEEDFDTIEKIRIAYEADVIDYYSYYFVDETKKLDLLNKTYVVLWVKSNHTEVSIDHISHIVSFLLDNVSWEEEWIVTEI